MAAIRLHEIAAKSGVSHVTVSRILGGKEHLHSKDTVERVKEVAREMGYRPNLLARSMKSGRTMTIGILHGNSHGYWTGELLSGMQDESIGSGYFPIALSLVAGSNMEEQVNHLLDRRVEGVIIRPIAGAPFDQYTQPIIDAGLPVVVIDNETEGSEKYDFVGTDDEDGARQAAEHLLSLGHRRFGMVTFESISTMCRRRVNFEKILSQVSGTQCISEIIHYPTESYGYEGALALLSRPEKPAAVFVGSDKLACGIYQAAVELDLTIPEDLSVIGYADLEYAKLITPALTTIRQEPFRIGQEAVKLIIDRIEGNVVSRVPRRILLKPELIVRASTQAVG